MQLSESLDLLVSAAVPDLYTGVKWKVKEAMNDARVDLNEGKVQLSYWKVRVRF